MTTKSQTKVITNIASKCCVCKVRWESWTGSCVKSLQICLCHGFQPPRLQAICQTGKPVRSRCQAENSSFRLFFGKGHRNGELCFTLPFIGSSQHKDFILVRTEKQDFYKCSTLRECLELITWHSRVQHDYFGIHPFWGGAVATRPFTVQSVERCIDMCYC